MPSTAINAQGSTLGLGTVIAAKTITAITQANPVVLTSTAHGLNAGDVVTIAAVVGMTQINGLVGVVAALGLTANTFSLGGIDSTAFTTYSSGGTATGSLILVGNLTAFPMPGGAKAEINVTNMNSLSTEFIAGLRDNGTMTINFDVDQSDVGQQGLRSSNANSGNAASTFVVTLPNGKLRTFKGFVKQYGETSGVDQKFAGTCAIRITGTVVFS